MKSYYGLPDSWLYLAPEINELRKCVVIRKDFFCSVLSDWRSDADMLCYLWDSQRTILRIETVVGRQCFQCSAAFSRGIRKLRVRRTEFKLSGRLRTGAPVYQESRECQLLCEFLMAAVEDILLMFWNRFLRVIIEYTVTFIVTFKLHNSYLLPRNY